MSVIFALLLFSLLIFVHELGHFLAAKFSGVQVNEFSVFMGPAIFQKQVGQTLYSLRCIPFGGYCAMEGEDTESDDPHSFGAAAWWKRLIILVAGAVMTFIAGIILLLIVFAPAKSVVVPEIAAFEEGCSLAGDDLLHVGDKVLEMNGEKIFVQSDMDLIQSLHGGEYFDFVVERDGRRVEVNNVPIIAQEFPEEDGTIRVRYGYSLKLEELTFGKKLEYTWKMAMDYIRIVRLSLGMLFSGQAKVTDMVGPVGIVQEMSSAAEAAESTTGAVMNMLNFGAMIAINLSVMNLLPIPALDGGRCVGLLLTTGAEKILKRKIDPKYEAYLHGAGMILLLALMAFIMFKDIFVLFKR